MDKNLKIATCFGLIIISTLFYFGQSTQLEIQRLTSGIPFQLSERIERTATLTIEREDEINQFELVVERDNSVFDLLEKADLAFDYEEYEVGAFISSIEGIENNTDENKFWIYYVNGERAEKAVDKKLIGAGDEINFKFEESPFK